MSTVQKTKVDSGLGGEGPFAELARQYLDTLLRAERHDASRLILDAVEKGATVRDIYLRVFQPCQHEIGRLWQTNQVTVAQEHYCTAATQLIMSQLYPYIFSTDKIGRHLVATCVGGELHEIGVRMVTDFIEMEGWDTYYLGANTPAKTILETIEAQEADILAISATITFNVNAMTDMIATVRGSAAGRETAILVGGRPFNLAPELWKKVGADSYAPDAQDAVHAINDLLGQ